MAVVMGDSLVLLLLLKEVNGVYLFTCWLFEHEPKLFWLLVAIFQKVLWFGTVR
jgi:hypothetical protein